VLTDAVQHHPAAVVQAEVAVQLVWSCRLDLSDPCEAEQPFAAVDAGSLPDLLDGQSHRLDVDHAVPENHHLGDPVALEIPRRGDQEVPVVLKNHHLGDPEVPESPRRGDPEAVPEALENLHPGLVDPADRENQHRDGDPSACLENHRHPGVRAAHAGDRRTRPGDRGDHESPKKSGRAVPVALEKSRRRADPESQDLEALDRDQRVATEAKVSLLHYRLSLDAERATSQHESRHLKHFDRHSISEFIQICNTIDTDIKYIFDLSRVKCSTFSLFRRRCRKLVRLW